MKARDIEDCDNCPLREEHCHGGMTSSPSGAPIEPPCTSWNPDDEIGNVVDEIEASIFEQEERAGREYKQEQELKRKNKIKSERARESRLHVCVENKNIKP